MLTIQRASAGSGKTYALAKSFILNLIAFKYSKGNWKLRDKRQIEDALLHVLAITFTNKATNEMKMRIINNLSLLSHADTKSTDPTEIPYLEYFHTKTRSSYREISEACDVALKVILNNFSLFRISTIDSFFQEILHTFIYEANINDSYQLEIDSDFVNEAALLDAINEIDSNSISKGNSSFWLKLIMQQEASSSQKWNPFNNTGSTGSLYIKLRNALKELESEDFKEIKEKLEDYYSDDNKLKNLPGIYKKFKELSLKERQSLFQEIKKQRDVVENMVSAYEPPLNQLNSKFIPHLEKLKAWKINENIGFSFNKILNDESVFLKKYRNDNPIDHEAVRLYKLLYLWENPSPDSFYKNWTVFSELFPFFGLILELKNNLNKILESNNLIQLSDTSFILKKIIGDEDAPFVYERLGNRINNYLIDEFQDTSKMQWNIINPLLGESNSKGEDSLIIGDPKQSIYRFRNADHTLITEVVPRIYSDHNSAGFSKEDNSNWRSYAKIVRFNNTFFKLLASLIGEISLKKGGGTDFESLYSNVAQFPQNKNQKGFIEIRFFEKPEVDENDDTDEREEEISKDWFEKQSLSGLGELVSSLIERGYDKKDIGILVNTNNKGKDVVEALISYNATIEDESKRIDFISEESLWISSSPAIEVIIDVMEKLANPLSSFIKKNSAEEPNSKKKRYYNWNKLKFSYNIFSMKNYDLPQSEKIRKFLDSREDEYFISSFMESLPTPSLSSLVETIVDIFLDEEMISREALYISSFQDLVNEFSSRSQNDPASFLEWWKARGKRISVGAPDGLNAVQIMTIHKSKGLEFKCVILPFATDNFSPSPQKKEWKWVETKMLEGIELPPYMPVYTSSVLTGSYIEHIYNKYYDQVLTDMLNMYYVAFTRAKNELYIFTKKPEKDIPSLGNFLYKILKDYDFTFENDEEEAFVYMLSKSEIEVDYENNIIMVGQPFSSEDLKKENQKERNRKDSYTRFFNGYYINEKRPGLRSVASKVTPSGELESREETLPT